MERDKCQKTTCKWEKEQQRVPAPQNSFQTVIYKTD